MKSARAVVVVVMVLLAGAVYAEEELSSPREPAPDRVSLLVGVGYLEPLDRFGERAGGGLLISAGGLYRGIPWVAPEFAMQYGFLEETPAGGNRATIDTFRLLGGLRVFAAPEHFFLRPWGGILAGWAHYDSSPRRPDLTPVIGRRRDDRDDVMLSLGGGADLRLHPNVEIGLQLRYEWSFADKKELGESTLESFSTLGSLVLNF